MTYIGAGVRRKRKGKTTSIGFPRKREKERQDLTEKKKRTILMGRGRSSIDRQFS